MNDVITWASLVAAIGSISAIIGFWTRYSDRLTKAEAAAESARLAAVDARAEAKGAHDRINLLDQAFGLYRERVAHDYASRDILREVETRLTDAIDRLGDRFDRAIEHRVPPKG